MDIQRVKAAEVSENVLVTKAVEVSFKVNETVEAYSERAMSPTPGLNMLRSTHQRENLRRFEKKNKLQLRIHFVKERMNEYEAVKEELKRFKDGRHFQTLKITSIHLKKP